MEGLVITAVITVEVTPKGIIIYLELQPVMVSGMVGKIPCVNSIGPAKKELVFVKIAPLHDICQGSLECGNQSLYEVIITCCLPCQPCRLDEPEFSISLNG